MASSYNENTYQAVSTTVPPPSDNIVSVYNEDAYQAEDPLYDEDANQAEDSSHNEDAYQPDDKDPVKTSASPANGIPANTDDSMIQDDSLYATRFICQFWAYTRCRFTCVGDKGKWRDHVRSHWSTRDLPDILACWIKGCGIELKAKPEHYVPKFDPLRGTLPVNGSPVSRETFSTPPSSPSVLDLNARAADDYRAIEEARKDFREKNFGNMLGHVQDHFERDEPSPRKEGLRRNETAAILAAWPAIWDANFKPDPTGTGRLLSKEDFEYFQGSIKRNGFDPGDRNLRPRSGPEPVQPHIKKVRRWLLDLEPHEDWEEPHEKREDRMDKSSEDQASNEEMTPRQIRKTERRRKKKEKERSNKQSQDRESDEEMMPMQKESKDEVEEEEE